MWPVLEFQGSLPVHLHVKEDTDLVAVCCAVCRRRIWFSAYGVSLEELQRAVDEHRLCTPNDATAAVHTSARGGAGGK